MFDKDALQKPTLVDIGRYKQVKIPKPILITIQYNILMHICKGYVDTN